MKTKKEYLEKQLEVLEELGWSLEIEERTLTRQTLKNPGFTAQLAQIQAQRKGYPEYASAQRDTIEAMLQEENDKQRKTGNTTKGK